MLSLSAKSQGIKDLQINEVLLTNTNGYEDNYGKRSAWIEIFNQGYYRVNIANYYLTNDLSQPKMYRIPANDPVTDIAQRHYLLFFASGQDHAGTQYLNFTLDSTHRFVALFSSDGKTLVDSVTLPLLPPDVAYCRLPDGTGSWQIAEEITPWAKNDISGTGISSNEKFSTVDPYGIIIAVTAMMVVFLALIVLYRLFRFIGHVNQGKLKRKPRRTAANKTPEASDDVVSGEVVAAISAALYQYEDDTHDQESTILTIERISRRYSPWNSKIFNLRPTPEVRHNKR